jgi:hypothetical protein
MGLGQEIASFVLGTKRLSAFSSHSRIVAEAYPPHSHRPMAKKSQAFQLTATRFFRKEMRNAASAQWHSLCSK